MSNDVTYVTFVFSYLLEERRLLRRCLRHHGLRGRCRGRDLRRCWCCRWGRPRGGSGPGGSGRRSAGRRSGATTARHLEGRKAREGRLRGKKLLRRVQNINFTFKWSRINNLSDKRVPVSLSFWRFLACFVCTSLFETENRLPNVAAFIILLILMKFWPYLI